MTTAIVWFRDDLRLSDQPALKAAMDAGYAVLPVYIHAPDEEGRWAPGAASNAWRHRSLAALDRDLRLRGNHLRHFVGPSLQTLETLVDMTRADAVFWNRRYEPLVEQRDAVIKRALRKRGLRVDSFNGALLFEPWEVETLGGDPYKAFTPFWKRAMGQWREPATWEVPDRIKAVRDAPEGVALDQLKLAPAQSWDAAFDEAWTPGEQGAAQALDRFITHGLRDYRHLRDLPATDGTSRLSPHLHFGEISVKRIVARLHSARTELPSEEVQAYLRQLGWREFSHHLMHHFPQTPDQNLDPRFDDFPWSRPDQRLLQAWRQGRTGIPIIDAGMRQLWRTGWMHNRVRMLVASYLTKHLQLHWRQGAEWFWDTLVDADLANNTQGWQWTAGTGADAAPYFRVFNPVLQARKFDPSASYITRWLPELSQLPVEARFMPWETPDLLTRHAPGYPRRPIVDLAEGRSQALAGYRTLRTKSRGASPAGNAG